MYFITHFRYGQDSSLNDSLGKFIVRHPVSGEEFSWGVLDEYPAEEFLVSEALGKDTLDKCCEYALRWLIEQDGIKPADFIFLASDYGAVGMLVIKEDAKECKEIRNFYESLPSLGELSGTPYIIKRFSAL